MSRRGPKKDFPRTARVGELIREIVASELDRIDDERLFPVAITGVDVDNELTKAEVYYDVLDPEDEADAAAALADHRHRVQGALGRQARLRRTPALYFSADTSIGSADRIESILDSLGLGEDADDKDTDDARTADTDDGDR